LETAALPAELHPFAGRRQQYKKDAVTLLGLPVGGVLAAARAKLLDLEPVWIVLLVLDGSVVALLTGLTLQGDDRGKGRHLKSPGLEKIAKHKKDPASARRVQMISDFGLIVNAVNA
jgi:hypothetical protein